jgi:UDP-glucose:(heptosyl)LPS alpha-1,3-glucosyltransferase
VKIALVRPFVTATKGGAEHYAMELAKGLTARGHDIHVFANQWDKPGENGVSYHRIGMPRKPAWLRVLVFHWNLSRHLCRRDYDLVLGMTPFWPQTVYWLGDGLYRVWTRNAWPIANLRWFMCMKRTVMAVNLWLERRILSPRTTYFLANSQLVRRQAVCYYNVPEERIGVVYPGVDTDRFNPSVQSRWRNSIRRQLGFGERDLVLMFAANNFKRKGLDIVIRGLGNVVKDGWSFKLMVVGAGRIGSFQRLAKRCRVSACTHFVGATDAIEKYYAAADAFVLPTRYDPCAVVCLEAMACGLPVITSRMNGASEFIKDGENGFVLAVPPRESELEDRLRALPGLWSSASSGAAGRTSIPDLSMERHMGAMEATLQQAASGNRARQALRFSRLDETFVVNHDFQSVLKGCGLGSHAAVMTARATRELIYNRSKNIGLFVFDEPNGSGTLFLKRHRRKTSVAEKLKLLVGKEVHGEGMREWGGLLAFHRQGLPAVVPVAAGQQIGRGGVIESFVATLGLEGYVPLDDYVARCFSFPLDRMRSEKKRALIESVAGLTRQMHWHGFNHRDYYLCHLFFKESENGHTDLRIIDLQRVGYDLFPARRWRIKDLAQLHYSSLALPLTQSDRLRFFAWYCGSGVSRSDKRKAICQIVRKADAIAGHDARIAGRFNRTKPDEAGPRSPGFSNASSPQESARRE